MSDFSVDPGDCFASIAKAKGFLIDNEGEVVAIDSLQPGDFGCVVDRHDLKSVGRKRSDRLAEPTPGACRRLRRQVRPFRWDRGDGEQAGRSARGGCPMPICEGRCLRPVGRTPAVVDQRVLLFPWPKRDLLAPELRVTVLALAVRPSRRSFPS